MASIPPGDAKGVSRETIRVLQSGRAFAALAVVAHHSALAVGAFSEPLPHVLAWVLEQGYLGVDFFFVLSGFIIYWSSQGKSARAYPRRFLSCSLRRRVHSSALSRSSRPGLGEAPPTLAAGRAVWAAACRCAWRCLA